MAKHRLTGRALVAGAAAAMLLLPAAARAQAPAGWQRTDLRPVTQPALAGGLFVLYASAPGGLELIAVDPATGRTVWSHPASPAGTTQGVAPVVALTGPGIVFLAPATGTLGRLTDVDVRTGAVVWQSEPRPFTTWPGACPDDPSAVCLSYQSNVVDSGAELRFDAATGRPLPFTRIAGDGVRELGTGLLDPGDRFPDRLAAIRGGSIAWNRPADRIFGHSVSSDNGWNFDRYADIGLYVGWLGPDPDAVSGQKLVTHLANNETVGFRIADGSVVWRARGAYACFTLPCPGVPEAGGFAGPDPNGSGASIGVRLVQRGTTREGIFDESFAFSRDAGVTIQGFVPATGRALWGFDAGRDIDLLDFTAPPRTGLSTIVVPNPRGRLRELDVATGARRPIDATTPAWCRRFTTFRAPADDGFGDIATDDFAGQEGLVPCRAGDARRLPTPAVVPAFVGQLAASAAGLVAWGDTTGLFARPVAP
jgi:hypothetical protein